MYKNAEVNNNTQNEAIEYTKKQNLKKIITGYTVIVSIAIALIIILLSFASFGERDTNPPYKKKHYSPFLSYGFTSDPSIISVSAKEITDFTSIVIPTHTPGGQKVVKIADNGFSNCRNLDEVIIPPTIKEIGQRAFENCDSLSVIEYKGTAYSWLVNVKKASSWEPPSKECILITSDYPQGLKINSVKTSFIFLYEGLTNNDESIVSSLIISVLILTFSALIGLTLRFIKEKRFYGLINHPQKGEATEKPQNPWFCECGYQNSASATSCTNCFKPKK